VLIFHQLNDRFKGKGEGRIVISKGSTNETNFPLLRSRIHLVPNLTPHKLLYTLLLRGSLWMYSDLWLHFLLQ
jgi:hypothetical protein